MTTNVEERLEEIESRLKGYTLMAVADLKFLLPLARLAVRAKGSCIIEMRGHPHPTNCTCDLCQWLQAFNSATSGEGGK